MDAKGAGAIVSGGASGLGEATVRRLHGAGAIVTVIDFNTDKGEALAKELGVKFVKCDVTDAEQVAEAVAASAEDAPLRIAINCAGTGTAVRTIGKDGTPHIRSEWDRVLNINLLGTMLCMTHEASVMSRSEPPAAASGSWPSIRPAPAWLTSRLARACGRWLVSATRRSCAAGSIATGTAPSETTKPWTSR